MVRLSHHQHAPVWIHYRRAVENVAETLSCQTTRRQLGPVLADAKGVVPLPSRNHLPSPQQAGCLQSQRDPESSDESSV
jgi:hypothetical protein